MVDERVPEVVEVDEPVVAALADGDVGVPEVVVSSPLGEVVVDEVEVVASVVEVAGVLGAELDSSSVVGDFFFGVDSGVADVVVADTDDILRAAVTVETTGTERS